MKATDLLRNQHRQVESLLETTRSTAGDERTASCRQLARTLRAHNTMEEELLYPRFADLQGFEDIVARSIEEHHAAIGTLARFERLDADDGDFDSVLDTLDNQVTQHVEFEEGTLIPKIEQFWTNDMLEDLGRELRARFDELTAETGEARV